jgi:threonyl-tRNA synthetase
LRAQTCFAKPAVLAWRAIIDQSQLHQVLAIKRAERLLNRSIDSRVFPTKDKPKFHFAANFPLWLAPDQVRVITFGGRDMEAGAISVRLHSKGNVGAKPQVEAVAKILAAIKERRS